MRRAVCGRLATAERTNVPTVPGGLVVLLAVAIEPREDDAHAEREQLGVATVP